MLRTTQWKQLQTTIVQHFGTIALILQKAIMKARLLFNVMQLVSEGQLYFRGHKMTPEIELS